MQLFVTDFKLGGVIGVILSPRGGNNNTFALLNFVVGYEGFYSGSSIMLRSGWNQGEGKVQSQFTLHLSIPTSGDW